MMTMNVVEISGMQVCMMKIDPVGEANMIDGAYLQNVCHMKIEPLKKIDPKVVAMTFEDEARAKAAYVIASFAVKQDIRRGIGWVDLVTEIRNHVPEKFGAVKNAVSELVNHGFLDVPAWNGDIMDVMRKISMGEEAVVYPTEKFMALAAA